MKYLDALDMDYIKLNDAIRACHDNISVTNCLGQRFIGAGAREYDIQIHGVPGNALGAYLDGANIEVFDNAQDAVGDTMNAGKIVIHGNVGDTAGYAMRGGEIYVRGNAGYRTGVHMKAYQDKLPVFIIGGRAGSFLGEYQAGGIIIVLGLEETGENKSDKPIVGDFSCTGMHGGKLYLRSDRAGILFPEQVTARPASQEDMTEIEKYLREFCAAFDFDFDMIYHSFYTVVTPDNKNPYQQMYVAN